jgi:phospholipase/carboxylesterase
MNRLLRDDPSAWPPGLEWLPEEAPARQLILLLHGWADGPQTFQALAAALRSSFPHAAIIAPRSPLEADDSRPGAQWYSLAGISTHQQWQRRVLDTLPGIRRWVLGQQQRHGVEPAATALGGFSQGGLLALHAACQDDGLCGRVLAFAARMVDPPETAPQQTTLHLFHGSADRVFAVDHARELLQHLGAQNADASLDIAQGVGHSLHPSMIDCALHRLTHHIPLRTWRAAMGAAPSSRGP